MDRRRRLLLLPLLPLLFLAAAIGLSRTAGTAAVRLHGSVGLVQTLYGTETFLGLPVLQRVTRAIDLSLFDERPDIPARFVSMTWAGIWLVPASGPVDIYAGADDLVRVFIDDYLVIERNEQTGFEPAAATVKLEAGLHRVRVEFAQFGGGCVLHVGWAPAGQPDRRFDPWSLFVSEPNPTLIDRARLAGRLWTAATVAWYSFGSVTLFVLLFPVALVTVRGLQRGVPQAAVRRAYDACMRVGDRHGCVIVWLTTAAAVSWTAVRWGSALNPDTLWSDDVTVACLAKLDSLWAALSMKAPLSPVFVALLWITRRLVPDAETSLQLWPYVFGLAGPVLVGVAVSRLTSSRVLGFTATVLGLGTANLAQYAIFVHPYSLDYAATALLLLLGVWLLVDRRVSLPTVAAAGLVSALCSATSVVISIALVHAGALAGQPDESGRPAGRWQRWGTALSFDVLLAAIYLLVYRHRTSQELQRFWLQGFAPTSSLADLGRFLTTTGWIFIQEALPGPLVWLAPFAAVGLIALAWTARRRWFALFVAMCYGGVLAASMLKVYPIGVLYQARVSIFAYPLTVALVVTALGAITWWLPIRRVIRTAAAIAIAVVVAGTAPPTYPPLDLSRLARALETSAAPGDAVVLNLSASALAGYYTTWRITIQPDAAAYRFVIRRPMTLILPRSAEEGGPGLEVLERFLAGTHRSRLFFFSTRRETEPAERTIRAHGFEEVRRMTSRISTRLIEYRQLRLDR